MSEPEKTLPQILEEKGLTRDESETVASFITSGKPGLAKYRAEKMGELYVMGYSCQDIHKMFPEYPLEILLWTRIQYSWDEAREKYRVSVQQETLKAAMAARMDSVRFLTEVLSATHVKWRKPLLNYIMNPDTAEPPKFIPESVYNYQTLIALYKEVIGAVVPSSADGNLAASPLVSVTVNNGKDKPDIVIAKASQEDIKNALMDEMGIKKESE